MNPLISVIVPIYNVENYLDRCLNSIINQSYEKIEIILVNDGSKDKSFEKCKEYEKNDSRIFLFSKKNGGLSSARNYGLNKANGEYATFIDSDDFLKADYILNLYNGIKVSKSKIAISQFSLFFENKKENDRSFNKSVIIQELTTETALKEMFLQKKYDNSAWGKLYHKSLFKYLVYPEGKLYEDLPVTYKVMSKTDKITLVNSRDYLYVQRPDSIQGSLFNEKKLDIIPFVEEMIGFIYENYPSLRNYVELRAFTAYINIFKQMPDTDNKMKNYLWENIIKNRKGAILCVDSKLKVKIAVILSFFGKKTFSKAIVRR